MCASIRSFEVMLFFRDLNIALYEKIEMEGGSVVSRGKEFIFFPNQNISIMISFPGVFCESFDKLLIPLPLCFVKQEDRPNPIRVRRVDT